MPAVKKVPMVKLNAFKPNERNPRKISAAAFEKLCKGIKRDPTFMELRPIVADEHNVIWGGNQRFKALQQLGKKEVPATWILVRKDLSEQQKKRFALIDNAPEGAAGYWDFDILQEDFKVPELEEIGFLMPQVVDFAEAWKGMPEHNLETFTGYKTLIVRFLKKKDYEKFSALIGQKLTEKTKAIWYPPHDFDQNARSKEYVAKA